MSKKTFISNQELELTQKIQLQFPRGLIPPEVLTYWENCPPDILRIILRDAFYFLENVNDPIIKVRKPIPFKLPHNEELTGCFYFGSNNENPIFFDVKDVVMLEAKEIYSKPKELLSFFDKNKNILDEQLDIFQLWAIYLRGYDFFINYFHGIVYAIHSSFVVNNDIYIPGITIDLDKEKSLRITWYSSWNNFGNMDFLLSLKRKLL